MVTAETLVKDDAVSLIRQVSEMAEHEATKLAQNAESDEESDYWEAVARECKTQLNDRRIAAINARKGK